MNKVWFFYVITYHFTNVIHLKTYYNILHYISLYIMKCNFYHLFIIFIMGGESKENNTFLQKNYIAQY